LALAGAATTLLPQIRSAAAGRTIKAVAFDAFSIFDPRPVFALAEQLYPGRGAELGNAWRTRQFEYQWLRALSGRFADFWQATDDALVFSANLIKLDLTPEIHARLMDAYLNLGVWPDVPPALQALKNAGVRMAFLSNATSKILDAGIKNAKLDGIFEHVLTTDRIRTYKPDPRAYQMAIDAFGLKREEIAFVAFAGWDAAGARWFGYPTVWLNRLDLPGEELGAAPDAVGRSLGDVVTFVMR
jgi:2-haloacid dehalogenase